MTDIDYFDRNYSATVSSSADALSVHKDTGSDWCYVRMTNVGDSITIRSKEMAEHLHFMLSQLLGK